MGAEKKQYPKPSIPKWSNWVGMPIEFTDLTEKDTEQHMEDLGYGGMFGSGRTHAYVRLLKRFKKTFGGD